MKAAYVSIFALGLVAAPALATEDAASEDPQVGFEEKLAACGACHGENGAKPILPEYPVLAGQHPDYLAWALRNYRDGRRNNPIMSAQVQALQLTDADIKALAKFFAAQESPLSALKAD